MNADHPSGLRAGAGPVAPRHPPFAVFAVPIPAARYRSTEGQNGASRGAPAPADFRVGRGAVPQGRAADLGGWLRRVGAGCRGRGVLFAKLRNNPGPRRAGSSRRVRHGRGHDPAEGQAQVAADLDFAKLRNDPPAGFGTGGGTTRGRTGTGRGGRGFCEIAQRPSRRRRLLSPGSARVGARPGEGRAQVVADVVFAKSRNNPPAGAGSCRWARSGRGHRPGERRAQVAEDVIFAKSRNDPTAGAGSCRWARSGRGHDPGKHRHRPRRTWFLRNCATTPWVKRPRAYLGSSAREHAIGRVPRRHARCNSPSPGCGRGPPAAVGMGRGGAGGGGWPARDRPWW